MFGCNGKWNFPEIHFLLTNIYSFDLEIILHSYFQFKSFPEKERERERERERRESPDRREREEEERVGDWRAARSPVKSLLPLSLSDLGSLFSLSLSLSLFPEMNWSENESVNSFPSQRRKFRSTGSEFPKNFIFRCSQTCGFGGKWFPKIIFTQNKRTLNMRFQTITCFNNKPMNFLQF